MANATTLTRKGQVTVPREIRDRLGAEGGEQADFHAAERWHRHLAGQDQAADRPQRTTPVVFTYSAYTE